MIKNLRAELLGDSGRERARNLSLSECHSMALNPQELFFIISSKADRQASDFHNSSWGEVSELYSQFVSSTSPHSRRMAIGAYMQLVVEDHYNPRGAVLFLVSEPDWLTLMTAGSFLATIESGSDGWVGGAKWVITNCCAGLRSRAPQMIDGAEGCIAAGLLKEYDIDLVDDLLALWGRLDGESQLNMISYCSYAPNKLGVEFLVRLLEGEASREAYYGPLVIALADMPGDAKRHTGKATVFRNQADFDASTNSYSSTATPVSSFSEYFPKIAARLSAIEAKVENKDPVRLVMSAWRQNGLSGFAIEKIHGRNSCGCLSMLVWIALPSAFFAWLIA